MEDQVVNGNLVATRWTARGTHTGPLGPLPPTGRSISIDGLLMDGLKTAEWWNGGSSTINQ